MEWTEGTIEGVLIRPIHRFADDRGWLGEIYREDEEDGEVMPVMAYVSVTRPGVTRGPHAHEEQTDMFAFPGPGSFMVKLWDNRVDSPTRGRTQSFSAGGDDPLVVVVPPGVVHGYTNISGDDAYVLNFPNRLFAGEGRAHKVDEVRYEDDPESPFVM